MPLERQYNEDWDIGSSTTARVAINGPPKVRTYADNSSRRGRGGPRGGPRGAAPPRGRGGSSFGGSSERGEGPSRASLSRGAVPTGPRNPRGGFQPRGGRGGQHAGNDGTSANHSLEAGRGLWGRDEADVPYRQERPSQSGHRRFDDDRSEGRRNGRGQAVRDDFKSHPFDRAGPSRAAPNISYDDERQPHSASKSRNDYPPDLPRSRPYAPSRPSISGPQWATQTPGPPSPTYPAPPGAAPSLKGKEREQPRPLNTLPPKPTMQSPSRPEPLHIKPTPVIPTNALGRPSRFNKTKFKPVNHNPRKDSTAPTSSAPPPELDELEDVKPTIHSLIEEEEQEYFNDPGPRTSGTLAFKKSDLPPNCFRGSKGERATARRSFVEKQKSRLRQEGRKARTGGIWRDDGLAIDWELVVPPIPALHSPAAPEGSGSIAKAEHRKSSRRAEESPEAPKPPGKKAKKHHAQLGASADVTQQGPSPNIATTSKPTVTAVNLASKPAATLTPAPVSRTPETARRRLPPSPPRSITPQPISKPSVVPPVARPAFPSTEKPPSSLTSDKLESLRASLRLKGSAITNWTNICDQNPDRKDMWLKQIERLEEEIFGIQEKIQLEMTRLAAQGS